MSIIANIDTPSIIPLSTKAMIFKGLVLVCAILGGVIVSTGKLIPLIFFVGGLSALILMFRPTVLLWVVTIMTLLVAGTTAYFFPGLNKIWWSGYILAFILFVPSLQENLVLQKWNKHKSQHSIISYPLLFFVCVSVLSTVLNSVPFGTAVFAVKSIFLYGGVWAALSVINFTNLFIQRWLLALLGIGLFQIIPSLYQYLFVRSARISAGLGNVTASDSVVGTFGGSMVSGGLSAVLALYLVILIICLFSFRRANLITRNNLILTVSVLMIPLFLMEVKVIFVYFPIAFASLYLDILKKHPFVFIKGCAVIVLVCSVLLVAYQMLHWSARDSGSLVDHTIHHFTYSFSEKFQNDSDSTRMTRLEVLLFWWENNDFDEPLTMLLGHGLGASRTEGLGGGHIAKLYSPLEIDVTCMASLLWDFGLIGASAFVLVLFTALVHAHQLGRSHVLKAWQSSLAEGLKAALILVFISLFYRNDIPYAAPMMFMLMVILGLLDWLKKQEQVIESTV